VSSIVLKTTEKEKDLVENLLWVLDLLPEECSMSSSSDGLKIINHEKDRTLELQVV
jgi:hypothetical protein